MRKALPFAPEIAASKSAARIPIMAITTKSSIKVKAPRLAIRITPPAILGGTASIFNTTESKAAAAKVEQNAKEETYDGNIVQCISLPWAQLIDGTKDNHET